MVKVVFVGILLLMAVYSIRLFRQLYRDRDSVSREKGEFWYYGLASVCAMFLGTFGISDSPISMLFYRKGNRVDDELLPGTIIVAAILPVGTMALAFLGTVEVDPITLLACVTAQTAGAVVGVKLIVHMNVRLLRLVMGICLIGAAGLIIFRLFFFGIQGGGAEGLHSWKLAVAMAGFFVFGGLNMIGLGATVPDMAILLLLGMSMRAVYPVVMAGNVVSCCFGAFQFLDEKSYAGKPAVMSFCGVLAVLAAVRYVNKVDVKYLQAGMVFLLLYCAGTMFLKNFREKGIDKV